MDQNLNWEGSLQTTMSQSMAANGAERWNDAKRSGHEIYCIATNTPWRYWFDLFKLHLISYEWFWLDGQKVQNVYSDDWPKSRMWNCRSSPHPGSTETTINIFVLPGSIPLFGWFSSWLSCFRSRGIRGVWRVFFPWFFFLHLCFFFAGVVSPALFSLLVFSRMLLFVFFVFFWCFYLAGVFFLCWCFPAGSVWMLNCKVMWITLDAGMAWKSRQVMPHALSSARHALSSARLRCWPLIVHDHLWHDQCPYLSFLSFASVGCRLFASLSCP